MVELRNRKSTGTPSHEKNDGTSPEVHLITGGGGYAGYHLGKRLSLNGHTVLLLDIRPPTWPLLKSMKFIQCDLTNADELEEALDGVDCVYHMASYGMSGREQLYRSRIEKVNVSGTENVIKGCLSQDITRLVYTSTFNVIFGGQVIENGEEDLPYLPLDKHPDHYSRTKSIAEQTVLAADGKLTKTGLVLNTCALRLSGVYGPGEQRHIPRIVNNIEQGFFSVTYETDTLQEFLHVENLAQAHDLAAQGLTAEKQCIAAGQAYFISDEAPINTFKFFQPLVEGLGYPMPKIRIPISVIYLFAFLTELVHWMVRRVYNFQPLLTRTEVYKTGVTHYFSIKKARIQLGYKPTIQNDIQSVVQWYIERGHKRVPKKPSAFKYYVMNIILAIMMAFLIMSFVPIVK